MDKVRYAMIGFGGIAEHRISREGFCVDRARFPPHPEAELAGVTDADPARREAAEALGLAWYPSVDAMLADDAVEAVFVATNNRSHGPMAERVLAAGRHCMVEKPVATTLAQAQRLQRLARERGLSLGVDHMMVHNALNRRAAELAAGGHLGRVGDITLHMEFLYGSTPEEARTWRCADPEELGGPLGDVGSHCLYMAEFLLGSRIRRIACVYLPKTLAIPVEDGAFIQFMLANGVPGTARVSFNQPRGGLGGTLTNLGYEIYGSEAVLRGYGTMFQLSGHPGEPVAIRAEVDRSGRVSEVEPREVVNIYQEAIAAHARSIRSGKPLDGTDAVHNLDLVLQCHQSARRAGAAIEVGA